MALSLIGYFLTMMSGLAIFIELLSTFVPPPHRFHQPHPIIAQANALPKMARRNGDPVYYASSMSEQGSRQGIPN
jgi:nicotinamidase-related amidase